MKIKFFPSMALALGLTAQNGQAAEIASGPPAGTPLAPVNSYALHGPRKGQEFDAAQSLGQAPGALLFIHELTRNIVFAGSWKADTLVSWQMPQFMA